MTTRNGKNPTAPKSTRAPDRIEPLIVRVRSQRVVLDVDLAQLYGVTTSAFNQAFKRNSNRFPDDFAFQLTESETATLRSQPVISKSQAVDSKEFPRNRSQSVIGSKRSRKYFPWAFTEHGALMAANILRSEHDTALRDIYKKLLPLLEPPPDPPKRRIGFIKDDE